MTTRAGESEAEASIPAADLNQNYIGLAYGANRDDGVVYARIAAIDIRDDEVVIVNDGVPPGDPRSTLAFAPTDELHFIR